MEFRILGPLEVIEDGHALDLGGQKPRILLAALLLHANEAVSSDRLVEALWPEKPPETAQKALQVYVSQLRKLLGKDRIETVPLGYLLRIGEDELDADRCGRLLEAGLPEDALALCAAGHSPTSPTRRLRRPRSGGWRDFGSLCSRSESRPRSIVAVSRSS
jgi:DNA-binding SARP family transcriptional activator